jgi:hypothetical protein
MSVEIQNSADTSSTPPPFGDIALDQAFLKNPFRIQFFGMHEAPLRLINIQASPSLGNASRKPQRITITVSWSTYQALIDTSAHQGRSLSNTAAYWLERQAELFRDKAA